MEDINNILYNLGEERVNYFNAIAPPIIQSSNFAFSSLSEFRSKITDEWNNHIYTRGNNPTVAILRKKIAALEQADDCIITSSGSAAVTLAIISHIKSGDHIICVESPYSWTKKLIAGLLPKFGVEYTFVDGSSNRSIEQAIKPNTKIIYLESPNSITFGIQDLRFCASLGKKFGIATMIDNSHCSPIFQNPIELGIDLVIHSASKYLNGHSDVIAGVICGNKETIKRIGSNEFMILGGIISPNDAFLMIRGLRTLPLRVQKSQESAEYIVEKLKTDHRIRKINFPWDPDHPQKDLIRSQMKGNGGLFSIELETLEMEKVEAFIANLKNFHFAVSWGGYESLIFPTCALYNVEGIEPLLPFQLIRFYIGLEDKEWLLNDILNALECIK